MKNKLFFDWFWGVLTLLMCCEIVWAQKAELAIQTASNRVFALSWSPSGKQLATVDVYRKAIKIWDVASGRILRTMQGQPQDIEGLRWTLDGKGILTTGTGSLGNEPLPFSWAWDASSGQSGLASINQRLDNNSNIVSSPDGKRLAFGKPMGQQGGDIEIYDAEKVERIRTLVGHEKGVFSVAWSGDGKLLASGGQDHTVRLWEMTSGKLIKTLYGHVNPVASISLSADGGVLASTDMEPPFSMREQGVLPPGTTPIGKWQIALWDAKTGRLLRTIPGHLNGERISLSSNGSMLAVTNEDLGVEIYEVASGKLVRILGGGTGDFSAVCLSADGKTLAIGWPGYLIRVWDFASGKSIATLKGHEDWVSSIAMTRDGKTLVSGDRGGILKIWDITSGKLCSSQEAYKYYVSSVSVSADSKTVITGGFGDNSGNKIWDVATGQLKFIMPEDGNMGTSDAVVAFSPDNSTFASFSAGSSVVGIWDVSTKDLIRSFKTEKEQHGLANISSSAWSADGQLLAAAYDYGGRANIWEAATGKLIHKLELNVDSIKCICFSPDKKLAITGDDEGNITLWNLKTGKFERTFSGHLGAIDSVSFSPDSKILISESKDKSIRFWDVQTGVPKLTFFNIAKERDQLDYVVLDPQSRFDGTNAGLEQLHYAVGLEFLELDQLKERYYTPSLWAKTMGFDPVAPPVVPKFNEVKLYPEIEVVPLAPGETKLRMRLKNQGGGMGRVEIKVGGKELINDARGKGFDSNAAMQTLEVDLSGSGAPGEKVPVEVVAWNGEGDIRSRGVRMEYVPPGQKQVVKPRFFAIVVGVSHFPNNPLLDLQFSSKDATDMAKALDLGAQDLFDERHIHLLSSDAALSANKPTKENIARTFAEIARQAREGDVLVVYFSGHGVGLRVSGRDYYCYLTQDAHDVSENSFADPQVREVSSITSDDLASWTNPKTGIKAQKQVLILDTCAAGAVAASLDQQKDTDADLVRAIDRLNERSGFYVLMGCAASAKSFEANRFGQGILTYSLLQGVKGAALRDGRFVDVSKLFTYAQDGAEALAKSVGLTQQPRTMAGSGQSFDIGDLSDPKKEQIPLARARPVLLRPSLQNETEGFDNLELAAPVQNALRQACLSAARGEDMPVFLAVEPGEFAEGIKTTINYRVEDEIVKARLIFSKRGKKLREIALQGPADPQKREALVKVLIAAILGARLRIESPNNFQMIF